MPRCFIPVAKLKNALRRVHLQDKQRLTAKGRSKIDSALFKCENPDCNVALYEGTSDKNLNKLIDKHPDLNIKKGRIELNHLHPVVPLETYDDLIERLQKDEQFLGLIRLDKKYVRTILQLAVYIARLYVSSDDYSALCSDCHKLETEEQIKGRVENGSLKRKKE